MLGQINKWAFKKKVFQEMFNTLGGIQGAPLVRPHRTGKYKNNCLPHSVPKQLARRLAFRFSEIPPEAGRKNIKGIVVLGQINKCPIRFWAFNKRVFQEISLKSNL